MANNVYTQDIILDADGKPVLDAMKAVQGFLEQIQRTVAGIGVTSKKDAEAWGLTLAANLKAMRAAQSDLRALQAERDARARGFNDAERAARNTARAEVAADKEASNQKKIESKVRYKQQADDARATAQTEKELAREVAAYERQQDRDAIASAKEVAAARREAAQAAVTAKARGITNIDDARAARAASDARLADLRREREAMASNNVEGARSVANRIALEKALQTELDRTTARLNRETEAEARLKQQADLRFAGIAHADNRLLTPGDVAGRATQLGNGLALASYRTEQADARLALQTTIANKNATVEQRVEAQRALEIANQRVAAAQRLVNEENKILATMQRENAKAEQQQQYDQRRTVLGRVTTAATNLGIYGGVAGAGYAAFNAAREGFRNTLQIEDEMAKLQAIAGATDGQLQQVRASIFSIGETSRFATVDLIKVSQTLAQAGVAAGDMSNVLDAVSKLATASGSTPDEAVQLVTSAIGSFQLQASEAARIADLMTSALNRTKLTVQQTGQAIQYVGATAFEQNIGLEQLLATVGAVAQAGVRSGSTIGTGFRQFLVDLQNPSEKLAGQLKSVGLSADQVNVSVRGLQPVLQTLRNSGFGAAQAYGGLETRAAAFYLVAKNNVDVMNQLQLAFAQQGAAAIANERAMNSVSAQWQRLQNIIGQGFAEAMDGPMRAMVEFLRHISDGIDRAKELREMANLVGEKGVNGAYNGRGQTGNNTFDALLNYDFGKPVMDFIQETDAAIQRSALNMFIDGWGDKLAAWDDRMAGTSTASRDLETSLAGVTEKADAQSGKISEVEKEYARLITQGVDLKRNSLQVATETINLTARFDGLAKYLTNAKDGYGDLMQAMAKYRVEALKTQQSNLIAQQSIYGQQAAQAQSAAQGLANQALSDPALMGRLNARERAALLQPRVGANQQVIADAGERLGNDVLRRLSVEVGNLAIAVSQQKANGILRDDLRTRATGAGQSLDQRVTTGEATLARLRTLDGKAQMDLAKEMRASMTGVLSEVSNRLNNPATSTAARATLQNWQLQAEAVVKGIDAALAPTKAEIAAQKKAEREAAKAEREAAKRERLVTQADVDAIGQGLGLKLGSGTRTPAEQEALHARGATPARGFGPRTSNHVSGIARDFSVRGLSDQEAERYASTMRAQYRAAGIAAQVKYERGGKNDGTGRHIHVGVRKGTMQRADRTDENEDRFALRTAQAQMSLDEDDLKNKLKAITQTTSAKAFEEAVAVARTSLEKVNDEVRAIALDELANSGIAPGTTEFAARIKQVGQTVAQNTEDFNQKVSDAIIASTKKQVEAAQVAFEKAVAPADADLAIAQSSAQGLDLLSLRGRVPDFVRSLASDDIARAQENVSRTEYAAMPSRIDAQRASIASLQEVMAREGSTEATRAQLAELNLQLEKLIANRNALAAQLDAGGLVPTTIGDGLRLAIENFRQQNPEGNNSISNVFLQRIGTDITTWADTIQTGVGDVMNNIIQHPLESLHALGDWFSEFFSNAGRGTMSLLGAFGRMAQGIIGYLGQIASKAVASQIMGMLLNVGAGLLGSKLSAPSANATFGNENMMRTVDFDFATPVLGFSGGGEVMNGNKDRDSVDAKLKKGEFVMQNSAVDSVGTKFMAQLNQHGSDALQGLSSMPKVNMQTKTETSVYVVPPTEKPSLGPDDVLVLMDDHLLNGEGRRLVQHISREG